MEPVRDEICVNGEIISRFLFIADASTKIMAGILADPQCVTEPEILAKVAFNNAKVLWDELCRQFKDDSESIEDDCGIAHNQLNE